MTNTCGWCGKPTKLCCSSCHRTHYCSTECQAKDWREGGHKFLCKDLLKAIVKAEAALDAANPPPNRMDAFGVVESPKEKQAQEYCYDAMEVEERSGGGLPAKIKLVIKALKVFPLSTEAWRLLGTFYRYDLPDDQHDYEQSVRMYDNAIRSARKLNPSWTDDRREKLEWGHIETRPYLRAVMGRALALKELGRTEEAIKEAKNLIKWNPRDNQGVRMVLCNWLLEVGDTESFLNLIRDCDESNDASLAYSNFLLQFIRWRKDEVLEESVQKALYKALNENPLVPDLLLKLKDSPLKKEKYEYLDFGGPKGAAGLTEISRFLKFSRARPNFAKTPLFSPSGKISAHPGKFWRIRENFALIQMPAPPLWLTLRRWPTLVLASTTTTDVLHPPPTRPHRGSCRCSALALS